MTSSTMRTRLFLERSWGVPEQELPGTPHIHITASHGHCEAWPQMPHHTHVSTTQPLLPHPAVRRLPPHEPHTLIEHEEKEGSAVDAL